MLVSSKFVFVASAGKSRILESINSETEASPCPSSTLVGQVVFARNCFGGGQSLGRDACLLFAGSFRAGTGGLPSAGTGSSHFSVGPFPPTKCC